MPIPIGNRDQHGDRRRHHGSVDRRKCPEALGDGIPETRDQKVEPESFNRGPRADHKRRDEACEDHDDEKGRSSRERPKTKIAASETAQRRTPRRFQMSSVKAASTMEIRRVTSKRLGG
jgi:hypothetical protein